MMQGKTDTSERAEKTEAFRSTAQRSRVYPRPEPRLLGEDNERENSCVPRDKKWPPLDVDDSRQGKKNTATALQPINLATEKNVELLERAERAEQMLEITRERLCRALEDGAANAASTAASAATADADSTTVNRHFVGDAIKGSTNGDGNGTRFAAEERYNENVISPFSGEWRGGHGRSRGRSTERPFRTTASTRSSKTNPRRSRSVLGKREEERAPLPPRHYASSLDLVEGFSCCSSDDSRDPRQWQAPKSVGASSEKEFLRKRRHPSRSTSTPSSSRILRGKDIKRKGAGHGGSADEYDSTINTAERKNQPPGRRAQLRSSDLVRMREVVARLRAVTAQLEEERAKSSGVPGRVTEEGQSRLPHAVVYGSNRRPPIAPYIRKEGESGEREAAALLQENANLRRKLRGLVALEELEGRAVSRGLSPLTGEGEPGADFFQPDK